MIKQLINVRIFNERFNIYIYNRPFVLKVVYVHFLLFRNICIYIFINTYHICIYLYYLDQKVSGSYSENQKNKFIHQNRYCPLQSTYSLSTAAHLCQIQSSKHFLYSVFGMNYQSRFRFLRF